ncbi:PREDICTED: uncharacterized protein K02A2.6-like [Priapulus caudatus]|uniref:Uncharacterized protein K02A2.6-like n=1 Tax=Priapulus caudatus TaxID=37621 RepID=A0ABM1F131_PRICU|nr:PREDICTED: uncharacterized protein K02A2.6-like [Priapulus caudatus]
MDAELEALVQGCEVCQVVRPTPPTAPLHPWPWASRVWQRVHIDFAEKGGVSYLVLVDANSKWIEVEQMRSTTTERTIEVLRAWFARFGLPEELCSDNGPQFISAEFKQFLSQNGIRHKLSPPYHPATNGAAERAVQTVKKALSKEMERVSREGGKRTDSHVLASFLIRYRNTPHSVTKQTPAELFLKRKMRTKFTNLIPSLEDHMSKQQQKQIEFHDRSRVELREFGPTEIVSVSVKGDPRKRVLGTVVKAMGPRSYLIRIGRQLRHVHVDHLARTRCKEADLPEEEPFEFEPFGDQESMPKANRSVETSTASRGQAESVAPEIGASPQSQPTRTPERNSGAEIPSSPRATPVRRSRRVTKPPNRLNL